MPIFLQPALPINRKSFSLTVLVLLSPLYFFAQSLTGLWTGSLSNDSNSVRKEQSFEIALTEYKGKVYGYSRSEFIVNDTLYYIMKRVKGTIEGDICEVTDDEIISYNFRGKLDKGIKVTSTFRRNQNDSTWYLEGSWKTNATKKYYAVTGKVNLAEEKDLSASKIFPHLEELNLANNVAFYKERTETEPIVKIIKPEKAEPSFATNNLSDQKTDLAIAKQPDLKQAKADDDIIESVVAAKQNDVDLKKPVESLTKTETKELGLSNTEIKTRSPQQKQANAIIPPKETTIAKLDQPNTTTEKPSFTRQPDPVTKKPVQKNTNSASVNNNPAITKSATTDKQVTTENSTAVTKPVAVDKKETAVTLPKEESKPDVPKPDITVKAAVVEGRKSEFSQEVFFSGDSLLLSIYDNGEIDGDTVSIYMNGEILLAKQGLKSTAIKKTIYLPPGKDDEFTLVLFAENLGKYPPNTGLLVVKDGNDIYNLRFSSDFNKSSGIVFRRKK